MTSLTTDTSNNEIQHVLNQEKQEKKSKVNEKLSHNSYNDKNEEQYVMNLNLPIFIQSLDNRSANLVCAHCGAHLPSLDAQANVFQDYSNLQCIYTDDWKKKYFNSDNNNNNNIFDKAFYCNPSTSSSSYEEKIKMVCRCELGCGSLYCSPSCRDDHANMKGHHLVCVGPVDEEHPLYIYNVLSMESGEYEIFLLALNIVAYAIVQSSSTFLNDMVDDMPLWPDYMDAKTKDEDAEEEEGYYYEEDGEEEKEEPVNYEEAKASRTEFILQMYSLLYDGLANSNIKNKNRSNNNKEKKNHVVTNLTCTTFSKLLSYITVKGMEITNRPSVLSRFCQQHLSSLFPNKSTTSSMVMKSNNNNNNNNNSDTSSDGNPENATKLMETLCELINEVYYNLNIETEEDEALYLNQQMMLNELLMDSPKYFDGLAGISIYPSLVTAEINKKIVHSCIPSCEITYKNNDAISSSLEAGLKWRYKVIPYKSKGIRSMYMPSISLVVPNSLDYGQRTKVFNQVYNSSISNNNNKASVVDDDDNNNDDNKKVAANTTTFNHTDTLFYNCNCLKCNYERPRTPNKKRSNIRYIPEILMEIGYLAQTVGNHENAIDFFQKAYFHSRFSSPALPNSFGLYEIGRTLSWNDKWHDGYEFLKLADKALKQTNTEIMNNLNGVHSFYPHVDKSDDNNNNNKYNDIASKYMEIVLPYDNDNKVFATKPGTPLFDKDICQQIIQDIEEYIVENGGWTTSRHYAVPTTDVPVHKVPKVLEQFNFILKTKLFPSLSVMYNVPFESLRIIDAFVVKYNSKRQRKLPIHVDQSQFSFTVALNDQSEYSGGGLYLPDRKEVVNTDAGGVMMFNGTTSHGGYPVFHGTRYIIAVFCYSTTHQLRKEEEGNGGDGEKSIISKPVLDLLLESK